ncbi:nuclear transport factor 2 family protein [Sphingosinicella sp. LHD-64]|uniref:nuclear transport factor 2 family protein n=1 Tax=Sphingosinicella sp. LHD-64 TaxID=3072139 RepID=UPI0028109620|nr:nuclear transport factor 2 family protein [Sphingosinicella sp. LHD-64]MDQ8757586.1 nuclear transport factor 2 family protein [Sphingosinicella sp. LHD-64]
MTETTDEAQIIAAERARRQAIMDDDVDALAAGMADSFHYAHINGMVEDRATFLARIAAKVVKTPHTSASDMIVRLRDGYALLTGRSYIEYDWITHESRGVVETLFLSVWEKQDGKWKIAAYASTPLPSY